MFLTPLILTENLMLFENVKMIFCQHLCVIFCERMLCLLLYVTCGSVLLFSLERNFSFLELVPQRGEKYFKPRPQNFRQTDPPVFFVMGATPGEHTVKNTEFHSLTAWLVEN